MPRDFGDWFGDQKPMVFNDPTPEAKPVPADAHLYEGMVGGPLPSEPPKLNPAYKIVRHPGKSIADAVREMLARGFQADFNADTLETSCARCQAHVVYPAMSAREVLSDHLLRGKDMHLCTNCQHHMNKYRKYP